MSSDFHLKDDIAFRIFFIKHPLTLGLIRDGAHEQCEKILVFTFHNY